MRCAAPTDIVHLHPPLRSARRTVRILVGLAVIAAALAAHAYANPSLPTGRGLSGLVLLLISQVAGGQARTLVWLALAVLMLAMARFTWRRADRRPGDRWWR